MNIYVLDVDNADWTRLTGSRIQKIFGDHRSNRFAGLDLRDTRFHHRTFALLVSPWNNFAGLAVRPDNFPVTKTKGLPACHSQWSQVSNGTFGLKDLYLSDSIEHGLAAGF